VAIRYLVMLALLKSGKARKARRSRAILLAVSEAARTMATAFGGEDVPSIRVTILGSQTSYFFKLPPELRTLALRGFFIFYLERIENCVYLNAHAKRRNIRLSVNSFPDGFFIFYLELSNIFLIIVILLMLLLQTRGAQLCKPLVFIYISKMDFVPEILKNILASLVSTITIVLMFLRYMNKTQISHANQISSIIKETAHAVFNNSQLEYRVKQLEKTEKENAAKMDEQFEKVNARLDQIYAIMANK
jgi:hypothetical protein